MGNQRFRRLQEKHKDPPRPSKPRHPLGIPWKSLENQHVLANPTGTNVSAWQEKHNRLGLFKNLRNPLGNQRLGCWQEKHKSKPKNNS